MPNDSVDFKFVLYPLQSGHCKLPKFQIKLNNNSSNSNDSAKLTNSMAQISIGNNNQSALYDSSDNYEFNSILQNMLPTHLFILPDDSIEIINA
jgi:hypothetical protein